MITTKNQAIQFLTTMQTLFPLVHPEDDLTQINPPFTDDQVKYLDARFDECYEVFEDPCRIILDEIRPKMPLFNKNL